MRDFFICVIAILFLSSSVFAQDQNLNKGEEIRQLKQEVNQLRNQFKEMQSFYGQTINNLQSRLEQLEGKMVTQQVTSLEKEALKTEIIQALKDEQSPSQSPVLYSKQIGGSTVKLMNASFNSLFTMGGSTAREGEIDKLQGGAHDPKKRGFTTQNLEFSLLGAVDPYLNAEIHLIYQIDKDGASKLEVEEAFLTTQSLPHDLQLKAGTYFTEFGRLNPQHPHTWSFVDQPIINTRMFGGDGLRGPGTRLSWLTPFPWYSEVFGGVQNANGETAFSFLNAAGEEFAGLTLIDRGCKIAKRPSLFNPLVKFV